MASILDHLGTCEVRCFGVGESVIEQGDRTGRLYVLIEGSVEVLKDGVRVGTSDQPGAVFGELAALLGGDHTATVQTRMPSRFRVIENPRAFFESTPGACLHVCELLARRLDSLNKYLVDVQQQFRREDHLGMVGSLIETLMHRQPLQKRTASQQSVQRS
jgi:CRP/FNR family cyclic AMP-dependent transcriptional regulator